MSVLFKRIWMSLPLLLCLGLLAARAEAATANQVKLTSDILTYDPASRMIRAEGNVRMERQGMDLAAGFAEGDSTGERFRAWGSVKARWTSQKMELTAQEISLIDRVPQRVTASGQVVLTRPQERLSASSLEWTFGASPEYVAKGDVVAEMPGRVLEAGEAGRKGNRFWASRVRRFEDRQEKITLRANRIDAETDGEDLQELTAAGQVSAVVEGNDGTPITLKGDRLVFSKTKATVTLQGNAEAVQSGRSVRSETIIYDLSSRRIEAQGRPQLIFTPGKESKAP